MSKDHLLHSSEMIAPSIIEEITRTFSPVADTVLLEGSWAYGGQKPGSDIDTEVVISDFSHLGQIETKGLTKELIKGVYDCLELVEQGQGIDLLQVKTVIEGIPVGVDIITSQAFQMMAQTDLIHLRKDTHLLAMRNTGNFVPHQSYSQRTFDGELFNISKSYWLVAGREVTFVPTFMYTADGRFMPGPMVDRYISGTQILDDSSGLGATVLDEIKDQVVRRYLHENPNVTDISTMNPFGCLNRWNRLSQDVRARLIEEGQAKIRQMISIN